MMQDAAHPMATTGNVSHPQQAAAQPQQPSLFNMATIRAFLWRQRWILIGVTVLGLIVGLIVTLLMTPKYTATATMRVDSNAAPIVAGQDIADPGIPTNETGRYLQTIQGVFTSRAMAHRVVDALDLHTNEVVVGHLDEEDLAGLSEEAAEDVRRQVAAGYAMSGLSVGVPMNSRILSVSFESEDPVLATRLANTYVQTFIERDISEGAGANTYALSYLEGQIEEVRGQLEEAERQAIGYARANRLVGEPITGPATVSGNSTEVGAPPTITVSNLANVNQSYTQARANRITAEERWRAIAGTPAAELPEVQQSPTVQALRSQKAQLETSLSDLRERYRDDFPEIRETLAQVAELEEQIQQESNLIKNAIRQEYLIAQRQERGLGAELDRVSNETLDEQDRRVQYNILDRNVEALRSQLANLLNRYNDISAASNVDTQDITELDPALVPSDPSSPDLFTNMLISFMLGAGLAAGLAVLRESFDDRVRTTQDLERKLHLHALGRTPFVTEEIPDEINDPFSPISEAYASIRASLDHAIKRDHPVIQFTSSEAGEGKTTSAVALARMYAAVGRRVLLVDLDLRRPGMAKMFGDARPQAGVVDVLYARLPLERALLPNTIDNLDVLPVAEMPANPVEVMSSGLVTDFIERYRSQYDIIMLDSSPVMGIADAPLLARNCDGTVFVVEANRAHFGKAKIALRRLYDVNAHVVGALLTKFRALEAGEGYKSEYNYYDYNSRTPEA